MNNFWKNKKVTAYIALKHHTRFITPIMEEIAALGGKVKYLVAQAERSQEITAIETNLEYSHIFDFLDESDTNEIHKNYHIMRKGFAATLLKDKAFSLQMTTVLDKTLFSTAQEYVGFKNYLKKEKVDLCIVLHELNRWGKMFSYQAKKMGIPLISLQEGLLTTATAHLSFTLTGHAQYSILNLVWGQRTKEKLCNFEAPEEKIIPVGNTHIINQVNKSNRNQIREKKRKEYNNEDSLVVLLLFSITMIPIQELLPIFNLTQEKNNFSLFIKFHPAVVRKDIDKWVEQIPKQLKDCIHFIHGEEDTYNLISMSDLCVLTESSTTGLETLAFGKPLVELNLETSLMHNVFLSDENAAIKLTPEELSLAIKNDNNFSSMINQESVQNYLNQELHNSDNSIENIINIMQAVVEGNHSKDLVPLTSDAISDMQWSIIVPVIHQPDILITLLENIAIEFEKEKFEVILIRPQNVSKDIDLILQSLEGDVTAINMDSDNSLPKAMNHAGILARGENLIFLDKNIVPKNDWLFALKKGINEFGAKKIFGAKIINRFNNIMHAGIVIDANNCPVSAYKHLDNNFPHACKIRSFQMINYFAVITKKLFMSIGGFSPMADRYLFMDLSLRAKESTGDKNTSIYLPDIELIQVEPEPSIDKYDDSIFFYSKWNNTLWENEKKLYQEDGVSNLQLNAARMTRALETAPLK